jgi:hypothetical protein
VERETDEAAWRAIVENYGERVELDDEAPHDLLRDVAPEPEGDVLPGRDVSLDDEGPHDRRHTDRTVAPDDDRYVPPPPPPLPSVARDRMLAWAGLFGSPSILLITLVFGVALPPWVGYLLVLGFLGGFGYLVVKMPRGPADPWDDGARL